MFAKITSKFRIALDGEQRTFTPGMLVEGKAAKWAIDNGFGEKAAAPAKAKAEPAAPKNKAAG